MFYLLVLRVDFGSLRCPECSLSVPLLKASSTLQNAKQRSSNPPLAICARIIEIAVDPIVLVHEKVQNKASSPVPPGPPSYRPDRRDDDLVEDNLNPCINFREANHDSKEGDETGAVNGMAGELPSLLSIVCC